MSETQRELAGLRAEQAGGRASLPTVAPPQVITFKTEREEQPNSKKLVLPPLTAKSESEMEELLVKLRTGVQAAAPGWGLSMIGKAVAVSRMHLERNTFTLAFRFTRA